MARYSRQHAWSRWHGTVDALAEVVQYATTELRTWTGGEPPLDIDVSEKDGFNQTGLTLEQLRSIAADDLPRIRMISIRVGEWYGTPQVTLRLDGRAYPFPALELKVDADNRTNAEGLSAELIRLLRPRHRLTRWFSSPAQLTLIAVLFAVALVSSLALISDARASRLPVGEGWALTALAGSSIALALLVLYLFPALELSPPGQRPRAARFGAWSFPVITAFVASIAATVAANHLPFH